jgi:hypothetical protein
LSAPLSEAAIDDEDEDLCLLITELLLLLVVNVSVSPGLPDDDGSCHVDDALRNKRICLIFSDDKIELCVLISQLSKTNI